MTNGPTEALNNLIKRIKRAAFGFRNFANYRIRALLYAGKPDWDLLAAVTPHACLDAGGRSPVGMAQLPVPLRGFGWVAQGAGLDANYTQARTFEEVREMARDLIALALHIDEAEVGEILVTENDWR